MRIWVFACVCIAVLLISNVSCASLSSSFRSKSSSLIDSSSIFSHPLAIKSDISNSLQSLFSLFSSSASQKFSSSHVQTVFSSIAALPQRYRNSILIQHEQYKTLAAERKDSTNDDNNEFSVQSQSGPNGGNYSSWSNSDGAQCGYAIDNFVAILFNSTCIALESALVGAFHQFSSLAVNNTVPQLCNSTCVVLLNAAAAQVTQTCVTDDGDYFEETMNRALAFNNFLCLTDSAGHYCVPEFIAAFNAVNASTLLSVSSSAVASFCTPCTQLLAAKLAGFGFSVNAAGGIIDGPQNEIGLALPQLLGTVDLACSMDAGVTPPQFCLNELPSILTAFSSLATAAASQSSSTPAVTSATASAVCSPCSRKLAQYAWPSAVPAYYIANLDTLCQSESSGSAYCLAPVLNNIGVLNAITTQTTIPQACQQYSMYIQETGCCFKLINYFSNYTQLQRWDGVSAACTLDMPQLCTLQVTLTIHLTLNNLAFSYVTNANYTAKVKTAIVADVATALSSTPSQCQVATIAKFGNGTLLTLQCNFTNSAQAAAGAALLQMQVSGGSFLLAHSGALTAISRVNPGLAIAVTAVNTTTTMTTGGSTGMPQPVTSAADARGSLMRLMMPVSVIAGWMLMQKKL